MLVRLPPSLTPWCEFAVNRAPGGFLTASRLCPDVNILRFIPGYEHEIVDSGKEPMLVLLVSFLIAFAVVRFYTRMARARGWGSGSVGGVHLHHVVPGVILLVVGGLLAFAPGAPSPKGEVAALLFGVGAALTLDEFALIFRLEDVYWRTEGRASVDAAILAALAAGLLLVTSSPFGIEDELATQPHRSVAFGLIAVNAILAIVTLLKGKLFLGVAAVAIPLLGLFGAIRLATPHSPWAHLFYDPARGRPRRRARRKAKLARATERFERHPPLALRFRRWLNEAVGGRPSD
jgi:hypothetical protein